MRLQNILAIHCDISRGLCSIMFRKRVKKSMLKMRQKNKSLEKVRSRYVSPTKIAICTRSVWARVPLSLGKINWFCLGKNCAYCLKLFLFGTYLKESIAMGRRGQWAGIFVSGEGSKEGSEYSIHLDSKHLTSVFCFAYLDYVNYFVGHLRQWITDYLSLWTKPDFVNLRLRFWLPNFIAESVKNTASVIHWFRHSDMHCMYHTIFA